MSTDITLAVVDGHPAATSLQIAEHFGKNHRDVLRAIDNLDCSPEFSERNFALAGYLDEQGKPRKSYTLTRDGFVFLCMGFTGKEAAAWKEKYIAAFNAMEARLRTTATAPTPQTAVTAPVFSPSMVPLILEDKYLRFSYQSKVVRAFLHNGEPWFVARDVLSVIGPKSPRLVAPRLSSLPTDAWTKIRIGTGHPVYAVSPTGISRLCAHRVARQTLAAQWMEHSVLPEARRLFAERATGRALRKLPGAAPKCLPPSALPQAVVDMAAALGMGHDAFLSALGRVLGAEEEAKASSVTVQAKAETWDEFANEPVAEAAHEGVFLLAEEAMGDGALDKDGIAAALNESPDLRGEIVVEYFRRLLKAGAIDEGSIVRIAQVLAENP